VTDHYAGPYGTATRTTLTDEPRHSQTADHWLITAPAYHPLWSQYVLVVIRLDDAPGFPPPHRHFPDATHELLIVALDPVHGPYTNTTVTAPGGFHHLEPVNVCEQYNTTDQLMRQLCEAAARAIVTGTITPETADAPDRIRATWHHRLAATLQHLREGRHAT
jgi:hypothetical protein